jgi:hypothetical protein
MDLQHFCNLIAGGKNWVLAGLRLLKNHRNAVSPHVYHFAFGQLEQIAVFKENFATCHPTRRTDKPQDRKGSNAFSTTRFAYQTQNFTWVNAKIDAVNRFYHSILSKKVGL